MRLSVSTELCDEGDGIILHFGEASATLPTLLEHEQQSTDKFRSGENAYGILNFDIGGCGSPSMGLRGSWPDADSGAADFGIA